MAKKKGALRLYKSYMFVDKDPVIDILRTAVADSGKKLTELSEDSNVSTTTLYGWFKGKTRRPQFATVTAVARTLGKNGFRFASGPKGKPSLID